MDRDFQALIAIAEAGTMTAAAERLGLTQPSLTKRLRQLELRFKGKLFVRLPRGMRLTPLGKCLYDYAKIMEATYRQAVESVALRRTGHLDALRIGAGPVFHLMRLSRALERLNDAYPQTRLDLTTDLLESNIPKLLNGELDVVLGQIRVVTGRELLEVIPLVAFERCVIVNPKRAARLSAVPAAAELVSCRWAHYGSIDTPDRTLTEFFEASNLSPPQLSLTSTSLANLLHLVASSDYAAILPRPLRHLVEQAGAAAINIDMPQVRGGAYLRKATIKYPIVTRFLAILSNQGSPDDLFKTAR